jgi:hypothetical protein
VSPTRDLITAWQTLLYQVPMPLRASRIWAAWYASLYRRVAAVRPELI